MTWPGGLCSTWPRAVHAGNEAVRVGRARGLLDLRTTYHGRRRGGFQSAATRVDNGAEAFGHRRSWAHISQNPVHTTGLRPPKRATVLGGDPSTSLPTFHQ
ncbi:hypothetical protein BP5796_01901 [Coleophoma crateriformis]|uniref:Uncharacterized protein n=1 Tax=Coleophoma crateriformis TaxID=565419 RepID=A0A3D8T1Q0_9HELO|nr:hypothetical protein BP5796_01901 [Coleophoma crateriformis]